MFDPRDPYERCYWHYDSRRPLSLAHLIALGSVDVWTAALVWLLLERKVSLTVAGPADPKPGVGKTTVLNALFQLLPEQATLVYTSGMYENFAFTRAPELDPTNTYVLCNEISDHQPFYMWGRTARRYLQLTEEGYHIATSVHADTIQDVIHMYHHELRLSSKTVRRLGLVVHVGVVGPETAPRRRWLTTHLLRPTVEPGHPDAIFPVPLSTWNIHTDAFEHADQSTLDEVAGWVQLTPQAFTLAFEQYADYLQAVAQRPEVSMDQMYDAVQELRRQRSLHVIEERLSQKGELTF
jgi:hypothetical protein